MLAKFFSDRPFYKNVALLVVGTGIGQIILFFFTAILTRLYAPAVFGSISIFLTWATFLAVVATFRYELAIPIPKSDEEAYNLLSLAFLINGIFSLFLFLLYLVLPHELFLQSGNGGFIKWIIFIPVSVFLIAGYQAMNYWIIRHKDFRILSFCRIAESTVTGIVAVLLSTVSDEGLLAGYLSGQFIILLIPVIFYARQLKKDSALVSMSSMKMAAKKFSQFPRINILQTFSDLFQFLGIILIGSLFYSPEVIGFYSLCIRVLQAPMTLLVRPLANVYYAEASTLLKENKSLKSLTMKTAMNAAWIGVPIVLIFLTIGPWVFSLVFGSRWSVSGSYAQVIVPWIFMDFIRSPISQLALLTGKQRQMLILSLLGNAIMMLSLAAGHFFYGDFKTMLIIVSIAQTIFLAFLIRWLFQQNNELAVGNE